MRKSKKRDKKGQAGTSEVGIIPTHQRGGGATCLVRQAGYNPTIL